MPETSETNKPDFRAGVPIRDLRDGSMIPGQAYGEGLILVRRGDEFFAIGAQCTHYGGPLAEGLIVDDTVRCPWHHACFSLRHGEALRAPALDPVPCWRVEKLGDKIFVREKVPPPAPKAGSGGSKLGRDCGRRRRGSRCGRHAAARGLRRSSHHRECRRLSASRSPEPI